LLLNEARPRHIFAKGTKPFKEALKNGWELSKQCEIKYEEKNKSWYVYVFVSKEVNQAVPQSKSIGIDVGIRQIISTSDGFLGNSISKRLKKINQSKKETARQLSIAKNRKDSQKVESLSKNLTKNKQINKTIIKQLLEKEAKRMIARGSKTSSNLIVEDPKVLANLSSSKGLRRWARTYFAYRLQVLGKESGILVVMVHPVYTSISCPKCKSKDKENRNKLVFHCVKCGHKDHSDINGAINLSLKGQEQVDKFILPSFLKRLNTHPVKDLSENNVAVKQH
jgi:putative transposase